MQLVADIGGTKTLLASYANNLQQIKSYKSSDYKNFEIILNDYLNSVDYQESLTEIGLAVAGPVTNNSSSLTNLKWDISAKNILEQLPVNSRAHHSGEYVTTNIRVYNDLEAIAAAICHGEGELEVIRLDRAGTETLGNMHSRTGCKAIVAPGTGLGMAYAIRFDNQYVPIASQGGHISFAPTSSIQIELLNYMQSKLVGNSRNASNHTANQVGIELVCSGIGIPNIFNFFIENRRLNPNSTVECQILNSEDKVPIIINNAINGTCETCVKTVELFVEILASAIQTIALITLSTDGIYLAGGIAVALQQYLQQQLFIDNILKNTTMKELLAKMPIYLCKNRNIALIGASKLLNNKY